MLNTNSVILIILIFGHINLNETRIKSPSKYYVPMLFGRPQALQLYLIRMRNHFNRLTRFLNDFILIY